MGKKLDKQLKNILAKHGRETAQSRYLRSVGASTSGSPNIQKGDGSIKQGWKNFADALNTGRVVSDKGIIPLMLTSAGAFGSNVYRGFENKNLLGDYLTDDLQESVMTPDDKKFYDKYMKIYKRSGKPEDLATAKTAMQNQQITNRMNFGLGQLNVDQTPWQGVPSYRGEMDLPINTPMTDQGIVDQTQQVQMGPRFNLNKFEEALDKTGFGYAGGGLASLVKNTKKFNKLLKHLKRVKKKRPMRNIKVKNWAKRKYGIGGLV